MPRFWRSRLPEPLRRAVLPGLERGERLRSWAITEPGRPPVAATDRGLWFDPGDGYRRLRWEHVEKATWGHGVLTVTEVRRTPGPARPLVFRLAEPRRLPEEVRTRVESSVAVSQHQRISAAGGVRVVARRRPGTAELAWSVVFDPGVDPSDPTVRAAAEAALRAARAAVGDS